MPTTVIGNTTGNTIGNSTTTASTTKVEVLQLQMENLERNISNLDEISTLWNCIIHEIVLISLF